MGGIAQREVKLDGRTYHAGEPVPANLAADRRLVQLGLVALVGDEVLDAAERGELEQRAERATAIAAAAHARIVGDGITDNTAALNERTRAEQAARALAVAGAAKTRISAEPTGGSNEPAPSPSAPAFDPSGHKVEEVLAHVDANLADTGRVRAAEAAGAARKTLLAALDARLQGS